MSPGPLIPAKWINYFSAWNIEKLGVGLVALSPGPLIPAKWITYFSAWNIEKLGVGLETRLQRWLFLCI